MAELKPLRDPIASDNEILPSHAVAKEHEENVKSAYLKHVGDKIRAQHQIPDANDEEALQVVYELEVPDATPEEFEEAIKQSYGSDFKDPELPLASFTKPSQIGAALADFPVQMAQDVLSAPIGAAEIIQGIPKVAAGQLQALKGGAFTGTPVPNEELQEGMELIEKGGQHIGRTGAFALGLASGGLIGKAIGNVSSWLGITTKVAAEGGSFGGVYAATREAIKPDATPEHVWDAFWHGAKGGALFGAGAGAAGATIRGVAGKFKAMQKSAAEEAKKIGEAAAKAKTLVEAKRLSITIAEKVVTPDIYDGTLPPQEWAEALLTEVVGKDVITTEEGQKAIAIILKKLEKHQKKVDAERLRNPIFTDADLDVIDSPKKVKPEKPEAKTSPEEPQAIKPGEDGGPLWMISVERKPGVVEIHNITASTKAKALEKAKRHARFLNGKLVGEVEPQLERRVHTGRPKLQNLKRSEDFAVLTQDEIVTLIPEATAEQRRLIKMELDKRPIGVSPYSNENPVDVTRASSWTSYLKKVRDKARKNPDDIAAQDELMRAESNFKAWQEREAAKKLLKIANEAEAEINRLKAMTTPALVDEFRRQFPKIEKIGMSGREIRAFLIAHAEARARAVKKGGLSPEKIVGKKPEITGPIIGEKAEIPITKIPSAEIVSKPLKAKPKYVHIELRDDAWMALGEEFPEPLPLPFTKKASKEQVIKSLTDRGYTVVDKPFFDEAIDQSMTPEQMRKLAEAQEKQDYDMAEQVIKELEKKLKQPTADLYSEAYRASPDLILGPPKLKIIDFDFTLRQIGSKSSFARKIAEIPEYQNLGSGLKDIFSSMAAILYHFDERYLSASFKGFSTDQKHYGVNVEGIFIDALADSEVMVRSKSTKQSHILINPWRHAATIRATTKIFANDEEVLNYHAELIWKTLVHEMTHQVIRFATAAEEISKAGNLKMEIEYRKNLERLASANSSYFEKFAIQTIKRLLTPELRKMLDEHDFRLTHES